MGCSNSKNSGDNQNKAQKYNDKSGSAQNFDQEIKFDILNKDIFDYSKLDDMVNYLQSNAFNEKLIKIYKAKFQHQEQNNQEKNQQLQQQQQKQLQEQQPQQQQQQKQKEQNSQVITNSLKTDLIRQYVQMTFDKNQGKIQGNEVELLNIFNSQLLDKQEKLMNQIHVYQPLASKLLEETIKSCPHLTQFLQETQKNQQIFKEPIKDDIKMTMTQVLVLQCSVYQIILTFLNDDNLNDKDEIKNETIWFNYDINFGNKNDKLLIKDVKKRMGDLNKKLVDYSKNYQKINNSKKAKEAIQMYEKQNIVQQQGPQQIGNQAVQLQSDAQKPIQHEISNANNGNLNQNPKKEQNRENVQKIVNEYLDQFVSNFDQTLLPKIKEKEQQQQQLIQLGQQIQFQSAQKQDQNQNIGKQINSPEISHNLQQLQNNINNNNFYNGNQNAQNNNGNNDQNNNDIIKNNVNKKFDDFDLEEDQDDGPDSICFDEQTHMAKEVNFNYLTKNMEFKIHKPFSMKTDF